MRGRRRRRGAILPDAAARPMLYRQRVPAPPLDVSALPTGYAPFGKPGVTPGTADETIEIAIVKHNAAAHGFNRWTLNGAAFSPETMKPMSSVREGRRYRVTARANSLPLSPASAHGLRIHGRVRVRLTHRRSD